MVIGNRTICVHGIAKPNGDFLSEQNLHLFFENGRNGGKIAAIDVTRGSDIAYITFEDSSSVDKILTRSNYEFMGYDMRVAEPDAPESATPVSAFGHRASPQSSMTGGGANPLFVGASSSFTPPVHGSRMGPPKTKERAPASYHMSNPGLTSVLIENIPPNLDEEELEMLIDHPKRGIEMDGSIIAVEIDSGSAVATVNFSSPSDAQKLLALEYLEYRQRGMAVKMPATAHPSAVLITGVTDAVDKEIMELYFSNPKKSGGDEIVEMKYFEPRHGFAVILYANDQVAEAVIGKKFHQVRKRKLLATQWIPGEEKKLRQVVVPSEGEEKSLASSSSFGSYHVDYEQSHSRPTEGDGGHQRGGLGTCTSDGAERDVWRSQDSGKRGQPSCDYKDSKKSPKHGEEDSEEEEEKSCTILVEGVPNTTREETVRRFFQSRTMSGGGQIEIVSQRDDGSYIIVFEERSCVDRILKRHHLSLDGNSLAVKEIKSPSSNSCAKGPVEPLMVFVFGDLIRLSRDALTLYLEDVTTSSVRDLIYGTNDGVAMVVFGKKFDYGALRREVCRRPVEDVMLGVSRVNCSSTIQVHAIKPKSEMLLKMYFENPKYSGGTGEVAVEKIGEHVKLIHFKDPKAVQTVASRRHNVEDEDIVVAVYYKELGVIPPGYDTSKPMVKITPHKIIKVDPLMVRYLKETETVVGRANEFLQKSYGRIDLTHRGIDEIKMICELREGMENLRSLTEQWDDVISTEVRTVMNAFDQKIIPCLPKLWRGIRNRLQKYKKTVDKFVMIVENEKNHTVDLIGPKQNLPDVLKDVERICQEVQEIKEHVTEELDAPIGKLQVLWKKGIEESLQKQWPKVSVQLDKNGEKLIFRGLPRDILQAMKFVLKEMQSIQEHEVPMSKLQINVISSGPGWKHVQALLKRNELFTEIECDSEKIIIIGVKEQINKAEVLMKNEIIESSMEISEDSRPAVRGNKWAQFFKNYLRDGKGKLMLELKSDLSSIKIAATADQHAKFKESLGNYLKTNTAPVC